MIEFENYIIRPLGKDDLEPYFNLVERNRKRLEDFFTGTVSRTKDLSTTKLFLKEVVAKRETKQYFPFLLVDKLTNNFIAFFDVKNIDWTIPKAEIGCYTDETYAGKGLTTMATKHFVDFCFNHFKFRKLFLRTHHSNNAAKSIAVKCGFEMEGNIRMDYRTTSGAIVDLIYYGRINNKPG